jgi:hypothetical protein
VFTPPVLTPKLVTLKRAVLSLHHCAATPNRT